MIQTLTKLLSYVRTTSLKKTLDNKKTRVWKLKIGAQHFLLLQTLKKDFLEPVIHTTLGTNISHDKSRWGKYLKPV